MKIEKNVFSLNPGIVAVFTQTMRGKEQLLYLGQPFIFEKKMLVSGQEKRIWRCNQWWNQKCRARVYTIGSIVTPLNKFHTHSEIVKRKRRTTKKEKANILASVHLDEATVIVTEEPLATDQRHYSSNFTDHKELDEFLDRRKLELSDY